MNPEWVAFTDQKTGQAHWNDVSFGQSDNLIGLTDTKGICQGVRSTEYTRRQECQWPGRMHK
jgi:hypothetical protein